MNPSRPPTIKGVHHSAFRCRDAEETRAFYQNVLGLRFRTALRATEAARNGEPFEFLHVFFEMADGNSIAFFDVPSTVDAARFERRDPLNLHFAMEVADRDELARFKERLEAHGCNVMGPIDHGFCHSIYTHDPNGLVVELTAKDPRHDAILDEGEAAAAGVLRAWTADTAAAKRRRLGTEPQKQGGG